MFAHFAAMPPNVSLKPFIGWVEKVVSIFDLPFQTPQSAISHNHAIALSANVANASYRLPGEDGSRDDVAD